MEPNENVEEQNNMDSAAGQKPPEPQAESLHKTAPQGEYNPYQRNLIPHEERHNYVKRGLEEQGALLEEADLVADWDKNVGLLPEDNYKKDLKANHALEQATSKSRKMLAARDEELMKQWIQQNPVPAAVLGLTEKDPYGLYAETRFLANTAGIPEEDAIAIEKEKKESPIAKRSPLTRIGYETYAKIYANPLANAGARAGQIIAERIGQWEQARAQQLQEDQEQYNREIQEFDKQFAPLIQSNQGSQHIDEATKELMAQQWKQQFAELNKKKNAHPPEISAEDYAVQKNQLIGNAKNYTQAVQNIGQATEGWVKALADGKVSAATPRSQRDLLQTLASGKGLNISMTEDGKPVTGEGLSVQNVNGQPTLVGYTQGQLAKIRKEYDQKTQEMKPDGTPAVNPQETSFEAFVANMRPQPGAPGYEEAPDYWKGVSIPTSQLATGEGMPKFIQKDDAFGESIDSFADDLANKAVAAANDPLGASTAQKWEALGKGRATSFVEKLLNEAPDDTLRSIFSDYLGEPYESYEQILRAQDIPGAGDKKIREFLKPKLIAAIESKFNENPQLQKIDAAERDYQYKVKLQNLRNQNQKEMAELKGRMGGKSGLNPENKKAMFAMNALQNAFAGSDINAMKGTPMPDGTTFNGTMEQDGKRYMLFMKPGQKTPEAVPSANPQDDFKVMMNRLETTQTPQKAGPAADAKSYLDNYYSTKQ